MADNLMWSPKWQIKESSSTTDIAKPSKTSKEYDKAPCEAHLRSSVSKGW
ncbi:MAG: hypothetical protein ABSE15_09585 [Candidatus Bathyarchaeia archaeon]